MPLSPDKRVTPSRHTRLFELLRQQEQARAAAARLVMRPTVSTESIAALARLNGQSLTEGAARRG